MKIRPEIYDLYWHFATERQNIFYKKLSGEVGPLTGDPILTQYKFCNVYRATDRVSQFLIKEVIYGFETSPEDTLFRIFFFRLLNKIETWQQIEQELGHVSLSNFNVNLYSNLLDKLKSENPIYGNAFILCANKSFGFSKKHENHLALLNSVFSDHRFVSQLLNSTSLRQLFQLLLSLPLIGNFMAYQIAIDFNYSNIINFSENDFTIAGPGALRGINKCFANIDDTTQEKTIMTMVENQEKEFSRLNLNFKRIGDRPLHAIDCQGLFCEVDKYCRVAFPNLASNRSRIKTKYTPTPNKIDYFFPPKWEINQLQILRYYPVY